MKVKDLIGKLAACDPEAHIMVWADSEDASYPTCLRHSVWGNANDPARPHVKGDWPDYSWYPVGARAGDPVVIIT